ncbi:dTDP-4-dehydrorhamnose 3,5-epimerase family protein [Streptomyces sp. NPDC101490]|uniref:dTDP-4-dehydrorhamnose 3,5-epimerase family protein n=1 Tax=Streptomyces sp. NPDC101490 TaxID=3366143 RepID=UPI0038104EBB
MTRVTPGRIPGVLTLEPHHLTDERGIFYEGLRTDALTDMTEQPFVPRQINYSVSRRGTLRGLHGVTIPPGQAKLVTCVRGAVRDVVVDLRLGSPEFGTYETTSLHGASGRAVYIPEGVVHGFLALTDDACVSYLLSTPHVPGTQIDIDPLDPDLAIAWTAGEPTDLRLLLSAKDRTAPGVREATAAGLLPHWQGSRRTSAPLPQRSGAPG